MNSWVNLLTLFHLEPILKTHAHPRSIVIDDGNMETENIEDKISCNMDMKIEM